MNIENIQQERSYHAFVQHFSSLFNKIKEDKNFPFLFNEIKEEDVPIYNAMVGFNTAKFLIENANWNWDEDKDKNKAREVILQEYNKITKAKQTPEATQKLESEVKERLKEYIDGSVEEVSIYGNHASITLEGNKKEFKISEFLNDSFCKDNGISGFSILHSKDTSDNTKLECGMHGFVYDNIRHYVVTDGSYEMTLNWYDTDGNKCTIKINIDKEGVEFIEGNITEEQLKTDPLKVNKDVKIGGLFLHQIQFREKGKGKANGVEQNNRQSSETFIGSDGKNVGVQATDTTRGVGSQTTHSDSGHDSDYEGQDENPQNKRTPPPPPLRTSSLPPKEGTKPLGQNQDDGQKMEFNKYIKGSTLDLHELDNISIPEVLEFLKKAQNITSIDLGRNSINDEDTEKLLKQELVIVEDCHEEENLGDQIYNRQLLVKENSHNKKTPPPPPFPPKNEQEESTSTKSVGQNQDGKQRDERYDNPTFTTFGHTLPGSQKPDRNEQENSTPNETPKNIEEFQANPNSHTSSRNDSGFSSPTTDHSQLQVDPKHLTRKLEEEKLNHQKEDETSEEHRKNSKDRNSETHTVSSEPVGKESKSTQFANPADQAMSELEEVLKKSDKGLKRPAQQVIEKHIPKDSFLENVLEKIKEEKPIHKWLKNRIEGKEGNQNLDALEENLSKKSSQGNTGKKRENNSDRLISPVSIEGNIDVEQNSGTQLQKSSRRSGQEPKEEELSHQKISEALENWKEKRRNAKQSDLGSSSQIHANSVQSQVDSKQLKKADFSNKPLQSEVTSELKARFDQDNRGLKKVDFTNKPPQNKDESELQKKFSQEKHGLKPADQKGMSKQTRELLLKDGLLKDNSTDVKKVAEREDVDTKPTIDKKRNLYKLLKEDEAQLKVGVIEEEREDTLVEHTNSHDRNRIALGNKNRRLLWTKHIAEQQEKNTKGISR